MLNDELTAFLKSEGATLVGLADLRQLPPDGRNGLPLGVSIAVALNPQIIAGIKDGPTRAYYEEYRRVNALLHDLGQAAAAWLEERGYQAVAAHPTIGEDEDTLSTPLPHKTVATRAGLGWIGRCALLVTGDYGSAVRLTTVLTDADLMTGEAIDESGCGDCTACVEVCPGQAVVGASWQAGVPRDSLYDAFACRETARAFGKLRGGVRENICGICIAACPWTQEYLKRAA